MTTLVKIGKAVASELWFREDKMFVRLTDGREIGVPLFWFPKLYEATEKVRLNYRFIGKGLGIHWNDLDEDLSVSGLFKFSE
jgi:hypothetical protein